MMRIATKADLPKVMEIWQESFGDSVQEIEEFFLALGEEVRVCVWEETGRIAGQLLLLPVWLHMPDGTAGTCSSGSRVTRLAGGSGQEIAYIYAVATGKEFRRKGVCTRLLQAVLDLLRAEEKGALLVPANSKLGAFYAKRGFISCFTEEKHIVEADTLPEESCGLVWETDVEEYHRLRREAFAGIVYVALPKPMLTYAIDLYRKEGGHCVKLVCGEKAYGILYREASQTPDCQICIQEITAGDAGEAVQAAGALLKVLGKSRACLQRSYDTYGNNLAGKVDSGYFNLVLD